MKRGFRRMAMGLAPAVALLLVGTVSGTAAKENSKDMNDISITKLKTRYPDTLLVEDGKPKAAIVTPEGNEYWMIAEKIRNAIQAASGTELPIWKDSELSNRYGKIHGAEPDRNLILLGNIETSGLVMHLYIRHYCAVDALYPGAGGFVIQTIHDPWGGGVNVVLLGGSDIKGIQKAADRFCTSFSNAKTLRIPRTMIAEYSPDFISRYSFVNEDLDDAAIEKKLKEADQSFRAGVHGGLFPQIRSAGFSYMQSGKEGYAKLFRGLVFLAEDLYKQNLGTYGGPWGMDADFSFMELIQAWDSVEESPSLSDADRMRITRIILEYIRYWENYWSVSSVKNPGVRNNHTTFTSLGFLFAADYFGKYYQLPQAARWRQIADDCFRPQMTSFKPQEDSNSYQWITLNHILRYALAKPNLDYITSGYARTGADLAIMTMDNLGYQVSFGDVSNFTGGNVEMYIWRALAAVTRDGRYAWALEKGAPVRSLPGINTFSNTVKALEPTDLLGVKWLPTDPEFYKHWNGKGSVPQEKTFEKISFRSSFDAEKPYLLLDGISACGHGHSDGNSILRHSDKSRIWLADCDYIKAQPKFHNMLLIFRDGQSFGLHPFSELELAADLDHFGFSRTTTPDVSGTDWSRNILWDKEGPFVVIDEVRAKVPDEFSLRCQWHTLGEPEFKENLFRVEQQGPRFSIRNLDGARLRRYDDAVIGRNWQSYKFAQPVVRTLQQVRTRRLQVGERIFFLNVLSTENPGDTPIAAERVTNSSILLGTGEERALAGVQAGDTELIPGVKTDARIYWISRKRIALGKTTHLHLGTRALLISKEPVSAELEAGGKVVLIAEKITSVSIPGDPKILTLDGKPVEAVRLGSMVRIKLPAGRHELAGAALPERFEFQFPEPDIAPAADSTGIAETGKVLQQASRSDGFPVRTLVAGGNRLYAGCTDGRVRALSLDGKIQWEFDAGNEVRAVWCGKLDKNEPARIAIGTLSGKIHLLDDSGKLLWMQEIPYYKRTPSLVYFMGADLRGDGNRALIAGSENWHHYAFSAQGEKLWQYESVHGSTAGAAIDLNGDGRQEVIAGTEYYWWHAVRPDGTKIWQHRTVGGPRATCVAAGDVLGDGKPLVLFGGADGSIQVVDPEGKLQWTYNTGDEITGLSLVDLDADGRLDILASSLSFNIHAIKGDGTRLWRRDLNEPVSATTLSDMDGDGKPEICLGTEDGHIHVLSRDGTPLASLSVPGSVRSITGIPGTPDTIAVIGSWQGVLLLQMR